MTYYTILTTGEFEDYEISGLYVSDKPVDAAEWKQAMKAYSELVSAEHIAIYERHGGRVGYGHIPGAHEEYIAFKHANHPLPAFVEKHGLKKVEYTELWTWGQA